MLSIYETLESLIQNVRVQDFRSSENKPAYRQGREFTFVSDCFQNKKKEEIEHYGQVLNKISYSSEYYRI